MPTRPSKCYRKPHLQFTRKEYIRRIPDIPSGLKFSVGNTAKFNFPAKVSLVATTDRQVSASALNCIRVVISRELRVLGEDKFRLQINSYPHHVARMHGLIGVAKAERIAKGMKQAFGHSILRIAQVKKGHRLVEILTNSNAISYGVSRKALIIAMSKLPFHWDIIYEGFSVKDIQANPVLPKRTRESKGGKATTARTVAEPQVGK